MDGRGRTDPRPISKMSGLDWGESLRLDPAARRRPTEKGQLDTARVRVRPRPPVLSAFDHINVVGLHNFKPTKGPLAREGGGQMGRERKKERARDREGLNGGNECSF